MTKHASPSEMENAVVAATGGEGLPARHGLNSGSSKLSLRKVLLAGAGAAALTVGGWYGFGYWSVGRYLVSTDDAYIMADHTTIAPKVSGYLEKVLVADNQPVKQGQVLARIDDPDYRAALDQARADVAAASAIISTKEAQLEVQGAVINAAKATLNADQATVTFAAQENRRYMDLAASGSGSVQNAQQAQARIAAAEAALERDSANLKSAEKQLDLLRAEIVQAKAAAAKATAVQHQAELNLSYTVLLSPIDGIVGNRTLRVGQFVQAGTQLMSIVPLDRTYVIGNFKETQLTNVHAGQSVAITVDMFPGKIVRGRVDSLAPASGQEFALLPPDNATGNFTKVVQRIPVKIVLETKALGALSLRPGMSVIPTISTRSDLRSTEAASASAGT